MANTRSVVCGQRQSSVPVVVDQYVTLFIVLDIVDGNNVSRTGLKAL